MDSRLMSSSAWWAEGADRWVPHSDDVLPDGESCSVVPASLPMSSSSDASKLSRFPGVQSSWAAPVDGFAEDSGTRTPSSASKSHSLAEKRRRDRINAQLTSLRKLIPKSDKMDKAALLGRVIDQVKDLKRKASEISKTSLVPTETDEVNIDLEVPESASSDNIGGNSSSSVFIRASVCCDDRPELFGELVRVLRGMRLTMVKADMTSVGGRIRSILVLCSKDGEEGFCVSSLKQSLRTVLSRIASSASMASSYRSIRSKRQRFFLPC
ncbi:transcription factor bHLH51 [Punica granatum]|uniref:BHLH domain-containing protein n=2 Tax=Punica granatum TaxID=22663 RepID=A0A218WBS2_PUNGR|nr:transcription factor bHLH51 [Punica granatum]OWM69939.1 hypothetical protein CDL15_Pgr025788 [Punica granatum]PKI39540.1 hypothetical protein CRG98_040010 [Punica granatum]